MSTYKQIKQGTKMKHQIELALAISFYLVLITAIVTHNPQVWAMLLIVAGMLLVHSIYESAKDDLCQ